MRAGEDQGVRSGGEPRVVVITGASAGVGRAAAVAFAKRGDDVALLARGSKGLEGARREVEGYGVRALAIECDVSDHQAVEAAAERVEARLGEIGVWVNNAMVSVFSPVELMRAEEFERVTRVTYLGTVYGTMAALRRMRPRNRGVVIQVGSALAYRSIPLQSAYCAAKHAIVGFTDSLRSELIHQQSRVRLTAVHLPALNTPQFSWVRSRLPRKPQPVPPIYQPEIAADAIEWASRHRRRELFVGLPTYKAILAQRVVPGYLDRRLARDAWDGQQHDGLADPDRPDNLHSPLDESEDFGAHGSFDDRSRDSSRALWLAKNRGMAGLALAGALLTSLALVTAASRRGEQREISSRARPVRDAEAVRLHGPGVGG